MILFGLDRALDCVNSSVQFTDGKLHLTIDGEKFIVRIQETQAKNAISRPRRNLRRKLIVRYGKPLPGFLSE